MATNVLKPRRCMMCFGSGRMGTDALAPDGLLAFETVPCGRCSGTGITLELEPPQLVNDLDEVQGAPPWDE